MRDRIIGRLPQLALGAGLVVWFGVFVRLVRGLWFAGDDFDFLLQRSVTFGGERGLLVPHNEHWSTIPILLYRMNFELFGLHHYLPYALVPVAFHVLISALFYILLRRCGIGPWVASLSALVVLFAAGGAGSENTLWDFQAGFLGSCLLGMLALVLLASEPRSRKTDVLAVVALCLALMSSGMGVIMVFWAGAFLLVRDGLRSAAVTVAAPAVVYLSWYAAYGHGHTGAPPPELTAAPLVAMRGLGRIWTAATDIPQAGPVVLAVMVGVVVLARVREQVFALAASGLVTVVAAYFLLGYTRSGMGIDAALVSRYAYFGIVFTAPALAVGLHVLGSALARRPARVALLAWLIGAAVVVSVGTAQAERSAQRQRSAIAENKPRIVAAAELVASGAELLRELPIPLSSPDITVAVLERASVREALPAVRPGRKAVLDTVLSLQVDVSERIRGLAPASDLRWRSFEPPEGSGKRQAASGGCTTRRAGAGAAIEVPPRDTASELKISVSGSTVDTGLVAGTVRSEVIRWHTRPGKELYVASTARDVTLRILVPPGAVTVCTG